LSDSRKTVLLAEDELQRNRRVVDALDLEGFAVDTADTITECVGKLREGRYDVLLLDVMMPLGEDASWQGVDPINAGVELLTRWHDGELAEMPRPMPVVVLTATTRHRKTLEALGVAAYLEKPCSLGEITAAVKQAAEGGGTGE
jgi:CheY-like chemotaxis protein